MPIDASIPMGIRPPQFEDPVNQLAKILQVRQYQQEGALGQMKMDEYKRGLGETETLNRLYQSALKPDGSIDRNALTSGAASQGLGSRIPALQKGFLEQDEAKGKVDKQKVELIDSKLKQSRQFLDNVRTPEEYLAWHRANHADPVLGPELAARGVTAEQAMARIQQALQTPGGFERLLQESSLGLEEFTKQNKPTYQTQDSGQVRQILAIPGLGGAPSVVSQVQKVAEPGALLSAETARRGQDLTDKRARDFNAIQQDANDIKRTEKKETADLTKNSQIASFDTMLGTLDRLAAHPGLKRSVGMIGAFPTAPGSDSANFQAELNTFQSQAFLPMVAQLKGMGALSDAEGKKLTAAVGALDPKMGEQAFRDSVSRITADMEAARERMAGQKRNPEKPAATPGTGPKPGTVQDGYRFKGGNPADKSNWEKI